MKNIKYIVGLLLLAVTSCSTPLTEEQNNSDSVLLKQTHEYTLNADGSTDYRYFHRRLYNSYLAFHRLYGETFVVWNPEFQTLKVTKSETTMADGKKVQSPENAFNETLPFQAADAPAYNHLREMVITHIGLEKGAVVELDYSIHTKAEFSSIFGEKLLLNESSPIQELEIIVRVPRGQPLNHIMVNQTPEVLFAKQTKGNFDIYKWSATNLKARSNEPHQVEGLTDYQTLIFSNTNLAGAVEFLKNSLSKEFAPDKTMETLLKSQGKEWELVESIKDHVVNNMNNYGVLPRHTGFRFRSPAEVWKSNGGTECEKAILLSALLKEAGFNAEIVLNAFPQYLNKEIGCPTSFDMCLVKVDLNGETRYFSTLHDNIQIPGSRTIVKLTDDISSLNFEATRKTKLNLEMIANLQMNSVGAILGSANLRFNQFDKEEGLVSGIPSSSFTSKELPTENDFTVYSVEFGKGNIADKTGDYYTFNLPSLTQGIATAKLGELPTYRATRLELPSTIEETYEFTLKLPQGFIPVSPAYNQKVENGSGSVSISYEVTEQEIKVSRKLVINQSIVPVELYNDFREIMGIWMDKNMNRIIVKPK